MPRYNDTYTTVIRYITPRGFTAIAQSEFFAHVRDPCPFPSAFHLAFLLPFVDSYFLSGAFYPHHPCISPLINTRIHRSIYYTQTTTMINHAQFFPSDIPFNISLSPYFSNLLFFPILNRSKNLTMVAKEKNPLYRNTNTNYQINEIQIGTFMKFIDFNPHVLIEHVAQILKRNFLLTR